MGKINSQTMKENNIRLLLNTVRKQGPMARSTLARELGLTSPAVTNICSQLLGQKVLLELGCSDTPHGRKPILLDLNPAACYALGLVMTTEAVTAVVTDYRARILCRKQVSITPMLGKNLILRTLISCAKDCTAESGIDTGKLLGLGIAAPGPLDVQTGTLINPPNFSDWDHVPLCELLSDALGIPAVLDKETNAAALAEYYFGDTKDAKTSFYLSLFQNSIGGSVMLDGKILHGFEDGAGEIGHMQVDPNGPKCSCGHYGCLESTSCGTALLKQARSRLRSLGALQEELPCTADSVTLEDIFRLGDEHFPLFEELVDSAARMIAAAVGNVATILSPALVTIGGTLPGLSPSLVDRIRAYVHQRPYPDSMKRIRIEPSALGADGCAIGAAMLALDTFQTRLCEEK